MYKNNMRENNFDSLRLFAAICVVVQHSVVHLQSSFLWFDPGEISWFRDGVPLFFIISGLLVFKSCEKCIDSHRPILLYYQNRFLRIAPAIYSYFIITAILLIMIGAISIKDIGSLKMILWGLSNVFLVPIYNPDTFSNFGVGVLNGSLWTIPTEFSFYIVLPLLVLLYKKIGTNKFTISLVCISVIGLILQSVLDTNIISKLFDITFIPYMIYFGLGIIWGKYWVNIKHSKLFLIINLGVYIVVHYFISPDLLSRPLWIILWSVPLSYAVIYIGYHGPKFLRNGAKFGDMSYGVYIWHMVVVNTLLYFGISNYLIAHIGETLTIVVVILISLSIACLSWWLIEKPSLKFKKFSSRDNLIRKAS